MSKTEFDKTVSLPKRCLKLMGVFPESKRNILSFFKLFFIVSGFILFFIVPQTTKLFLIKNSLDDFIDVVTTVLVPESVACVKLLILWFNKQGKVHNIFHTVLIID